MNEEIMRMHGAHVSEVNRRNAARGLCLFHNQGEQPPATHLVLYKIGNVVPLCTPCVEWIQSDEAPQDDMSIPVAIERLGEVDGEGE